MGKKSKANARNIHTENKPPVTNKKDCDGKYPATSKGIEKKCPKNNVPVLRKVEKVTEQQNDGYVPFLHAIRKSSKKKKKMGHPIIIEAKEKCSAVPFPSPLHYKGTETAVMPSLPINTFHFSKKKKAQKVESKISVTTVQSIKPNSSTLENNSKPVVTNGHDKAMEIEVSEVHSKAECVGPTKILTNLHPEKIQDPFKSAKTHGLDTTKATPQKIQSGIGDSKNLLSTNVKLPRFYSFRNKVLVIMESDGKFCFHGKLKIRALYGAIRVYGYVINSARTNSPLSIYSPRAYSPVAIEAIDSETVERDISKIWGILEEQCDDRKLANRLRSDISSIREGWAVLLLENFHNRLTNFLAANFPHNLFPRIDDPSNYTWLDPRRAEIVLQANLRFEESHSKVVIDSRGIDDVADAICYEWEIKKSSRTIIAGGKGVGKSTMSRYLVNKLLAINESVVYVDLDPGQAEFTPAGCISLTIVDEPLLGPNFSHLRTPYYQLYVGNVDVTRCLTHYIDEVEKLVDRLNSDPKLAHRPVVINTMGFCKGIGSDIINYIIKILSPTDLVQILSRRSKNNFDDALSRQTIDRQSLGWMTWRKETNRDNPTRHRLHVIYSEAETSTGPAETWNLEAHQQRDLAMTSYLSDIGKINDSPVSQMRTFASSIDATPPYVVPFAAMSVSLVGAFVPHVLSVMNGNIVALCGLDMESMDESNGEEIATSCYPRVLVRPPLSTCYGFGILRGVDIEKEQLFIGTPLSLSRMKHVNCLVGSIDFPQNLLQRHQQGAPYTGSDCNLPTSRQPRRGYMRARYPTDT